MLMSKQEVYYQMEAASGETVRVPKSQLKKWMEGQAAIERGEAPHISEESYARLCEILGIPKQK